MIIVQVMNRNTGRKARVRTKSPAQAMRVLKMLGTLDGVWYAYGDYSERKGSK